MVNLVPRKELLIFSHQAPAKRLIGEEAPNLPQNCCELDPPTTREDEFKATLSLFFLIRISTFVVSGCNLDTW